MEEWVLLSPSPSNPACEGNVSQSALAVQYILDGDYEKVLFPTLSFATLTPTVKDFFHHDYTQQERETLANLDFEEFVRLRVVAFASDSSESQLWLLCVGIACLNSFVQHSWTGPDLSYSATSLFSTDAFLPETDEKQFHKNLIEQLTIDGESAYHMTPNPLFLILAKCILVKNSHHLATLQTAEWWKYRCLFMHERILENPSATMHKEIFHSLKTVQEEVMSRVCKDGRFENTASILKLEYGIACHHFSADNEAKMHYKAAQESSGLKWELTGALGKRTKFQTFDVAQLIIIATSTDKSKSDASLTKQLPENLPLNDDTLLESISITDLENDTNDLKIVDQCILLAFCLNYKNTNPADGLTDEQMFSFVRRVLENPNNWMVHTMALLLRSRLESKKSRTVERGTFQLQALVDQFNSVDSSVVERMQYFYSLYLPSKWEMERELGERFLSIGALRSALEIFERLEMWEDVITCYRNLDNDQKAEEIVKRLLGENPDSPKFLCLLGDLQKNPDLYVKAWEKSGARFARAMRSLAAQHYRLKQYQETIDCYQKALEINPLFLNSWFVTGCAAMHLENWEVAANAFNRVVNIEPDNAEAWTNLASVLIRTKRKVDAWRALREALKSMFDNFKIWENYLYTSVDIGEFEESLLAIRRLVDIRCEKIRNVDHFLDAQVIEILIVAMKDDKLDRAGNPASRLIPKMQELMEYVSNKITLTSALWKQFASLYVLSGDYRKCIDTLTKRSTFWMDHAELNMDVLVFKNAIEAVVDLADAYKNYGEMKQTNRMDGELVDVAKDWHYRGRKALRSLASRTKDSYENATEHADLLLFIKNY